MTDKLLTVNAVAERLSLMPQRVYELTWEGKLPRVLIGRNVRIAETALEAYIDRQGKELIDR